jgi:hypothetical protein
MVKMWRTDIVARLVAIRDQHGSRIPQADEPTAETVAPEAGTTFPRLAAAAVSLLGLFGLLLTHETLTADQFPAIRPITQPVKTGGVTRPLSPNCDVRRRDPAISG